MGVCGGSLGGRHPLSVQSARGRREIVMEGSTRSIYGLLSQTDCVDSSADFS